MEGPLAIDSQSIMALFSCILQRSVIVIGRMLQVVVRFVVVELMHDQITCRKLQAFVRLDITQLIMLQPIASHNFKSLKKNSG